VHACDHDYNVVVDPKIDGVGEAAQKRSPGTAAYDWVTEGVLGDRIDQCVRSRQELMPKTSALGLVPQKCFIDVRRCRWADNALH
jgi:hypothetical protein